MSLPTLRDLIHTYFSVGELRRLCLDLDIEFEDLLGEAKIDKAQSLVELCDRHGRSSDLRDRCQQLRPHAHWPDLDELETNGDVAPNPQLDPNLLALLEIEKGRCRTRNVGFFTPNLLLAILSPATSIPRRIFNQTIDEDKTEHLLKMLREYVPPANHPFTDFDWDDRLDVREASLRARQEKQPFINARLLLYGILHTESETQKELQRALGNELFERLCRQAESDDLYNGTPGIDGLFNRPD